MFEIRCCAANLRLSALGGSVLILYMEWISLCASCAYVDRREGRVSVVILLAVTCISMTYAKLK